MNSDIFIATTVTDLQSVLWQFLSILGLFILTVLTPGPDFLAIVQASLNKGLKTGLMTALGIGTGLVFHCTYSVFGIAWLITQTPALFSIIKVLGGLYIAYLGIQSFRSGSIAPIEPEPCKSSESNSSNSSVLHNQSVFSRGGFVTGLLVNLLNAKAMVWFVFFYSSVIPESFTLLHRSLFAICSIVSAVTTFSLLAIFISRPFIRTGLQKAGFYINIVIGLSFLIIAGDILYGLIPIF